MTRAATAISPLWITENDPDADVRAELEIAHGLTRFHRATMGRRAREIGRFASEKGRVAAATELRQHAVTDIVMPLPAPEMSTSALPDLFQSRRSADRRDVSGAVPIDILSSLLHLAARTNGQRASALSPERVYHTRPYPSAGALFPCETYIVLPTESPVRYDAIAHALVDYGAAPFDFRDVETSKQATAPACAIVIAADLDRVMPKYGGRGYRFACLEAGHLSQNLILAAESLNLSSLCYGAYFDAELEQRLALDGVREIVLAVVLIGPKCQGA